MTDDIMMRLRLAARVTHAKVGLLVTGTGRVSWRDVQRHKVDVGGLKSAEELRQLLAAKFKDLVDQGMLVLPAPGKMD